MNKILLLIFGLLLFFGSSYAQVANENAIYIVDSIQVLEEPSAEEGSLDPNDIDHMVVMRNKDTLKAMGYDKMDVAFFVFTKAYVNRPEEIRRIPSSKQMFKNPDGNWCLKKSNVPYTGRYIDYYYNGSKEGEGAFKDGVVTGCNVHYFPNGKIYTERCYEAEMERFTENYIDGSKRQKSQSNKGVETGVWDVYFPNGQLMQQLTFENGVLVGEVLNYRSTGKLSAREVVKKGKKEIDPGMEKVYKLYEKGVDAEKEGNHKQAYKQYTKCLEIDSTYAEAYFARGTSKLNEQQFDDAIADFDKALLLEPYMKQALYNRAISLIQKHTQGRTLSTNQYVTVMATKKKETIPAAALEKICSDLHGAWLMDPKSTKVKEAIAVYCIQN